MEEHIDEVKINDKVINSRNPEILNLNVTQTKLFALWQVTPVPKRVAKQESPKMNEGNIPI